MERAEAVAALVSIARELSSGNPFTKSKKAESFAVSSGSLDPSRVRKK
jgi:hypothetical protein